MRTFGEILREKRTAKGYTREKLAELLDTSAHNIYYWEQGRAFPSLMNFVSVADFFGCTLDELIDRKVER